MPRCPTGLRLCNAVDEVRTDSAFTIMRPSRPKAQLDAVRRALEQHDDGCWECRESKSTPDAA